jgi:very-short-patch-repair endonuclease
MVKISSAGGGSASGGKKEQKVLVAVVKNKRDLDLVLKEKWYRIPVKYAPKQKFKYLAFYEPASGKLGKKIVYFAKIKKIETAIRRRLLPKESLHPRASEEYLYLKLEKVYKLPLPIRNTNCRRVTFAFTTLPQLKKAKDILDLYNVPPIEKIFAKALKKAKIKFVREFCVNKSAPSKRYRLDFAVFCPNGKIAIECDGIKSHSLRSQKIKDCAKDKFLRRIGWQIFRLKEEEIINNIQNAVLKLKGKMKSLYDL